MQQWENVRQQWSLACLSAPLRSVAASVIRAQIPDIWKTGSFLPRLAPISCVKTAPRTHVQLPSTGLEVGEWVADSVLRGEIDHNLLYKPFPERSKPSRDSRVPNVTSDRFYQCKCCLGGETDS